MEALAAAAASTQPDAQAEGDSVVDLSDREDGDGLSDASRARRKTKRKVPAVDEDEEAKNDAALVRAADAAEAQHALVVAAKKRRAEADALSAAPMEDGEEPPSDDVMIFQTIADLKKDPRYFRNMPAEEWRVRFSKQADQDWSAWASHPRFPGRGMPTVISPPGAAMFVHMWPGGTLKAFMSDSPFPAESTKEAHYAYGNDLRADEEMVAWMEYLKVMETTILDQVLKHAGASAYARARATEMRKEWWELRWPGMKRDIQARDRATWTPEEVELMTHPLDPPPLPFSEIRNFALANFVTRVVKFRKEPSAKDPTRKVDVPGSEYVIYKRPLFHVPNKDERIDILQRMKKQKPLFDNEFLASLDKRIIPYVMEMAAMGNPAEMRLLTDIPLYTVNERGDNEVVESHQRSLFAEGDVCYSVLTIRINCWTIKNTMGLIPQPQAVYFVREGDRSSLLAQIEAMARKYPVRGKTAFASIAAARNLLMIENGSPGDAGAGAAAESFPK